jgi:hypothetical protein
MGLWGWVVTFALCFLFSAAGSLWLRAATFPDLAATLCEAVPPIPATAALLFLVGLRFMLARLSPRLRLSNAQIVAVFAFVSVSVSIGFVNLYRPALAWLMAPTYSTGAAYQKIKDYMPEWLAPTDKTVVNGFWYGADSVPWAQWLVPLMCIGAAYFLLYLIVACMMRLLYKRWSQEERLSFPVADLTLSMVEEDQRRLGIAGSIFRSWTFWAGGVFALLFNLVYIIPALVGWPQPPTWLNAAAFFPDPPWNAGGQWQIRLNPVIFGLGYFVSMDVLLSTWVFFLFLKAQAVLHASFGVSNQTLFHIGELQACGAYVAVAALSLWAARHYIWKALSRFIPGRSGPDDTQEAGPWTIALMAAGVGGLLAIMMKAGVAAWLALVFLGMIIVRALVTARVRAQAGMPIIYFHVGTVRTMAWLMGGALLIRSGMQSVAALVFMGFLAEGCYLAPHHADAFRLADRSKLGTRRWMAIVMVAVLFGLLMVNATQLPAIYKYGAVNLPGMSDPHWWISDLVMSADTQTPVEPFRLYMAGEGMVVTGVLTYLRQFYWFPFHPMGYLIACAIGYRVFAPILAIWAIKWIILKYFGGSVHRKAKSFFIGLVMTHFFIAAVWAVLAIFRWPPTQPSMGGYFIGFW